MAADRVVLIGLARRPERVAAAVARIRAAGFHPDLFVAHDHELGWVGCHTSHHAVWTDAAADGVETLVVFEDDVEFRPDAQAAYEAVRLAGWDVLLLGAELLGDPTGTPPLVTPTGWRRTHAYVLRAPAIAALSTALSTPRQPVDFAMADALTTGAARHLRTRALTPFCAGVAGDGISDTGSGALVGPHYFDGITRPR